MYKVLIVDDEPWVVKSLVARVDWKAEGFEVVAVAHDGFAAIEIVIRETPDLVITDVKMPGMSGLELAESIRMRCGNTISILMISGHAEFAYVQKALRYEIAGYCLKPFDEFELRAALQMARKQLDLRQVQESAAKRVDFIELLYNHDDPQHAPAQVLEENGIRWSATSNILLFFRNLAMPQDISLPYHMAKHGPGCRLYLIDAVDLGAFREGLRNLFCRDGEGVGVSLPFAHAGLAPEALYQAQIAAYTPYLLEDPPSAICLYQESVLDPVLRMLASVMQSKRYIEAAIIVEEVERGEHGIPNIEDLLRLYNLVFHISSMLQPDESEILSHYDQLTARFGRPSELYRYLIGLLRDADCSKPIWQPGEAGNEVFADIVAFLMSHFDESISLQSIAERFSYHAGYVSQLFKRETGQTFKHFLTNLRLSKACQYLSMGNDPIKSIAEMVGFQDYYYFCRIFKIKYGRTPTQYRMESRT